MDAPDDRPRVLFFSGLGSDERLVAPQLGIEAAVEHQPWREPLEDESLADYAQRLVEQVSFDPPPYVAGISLGGMIAQEVAARRPVAGVILIASCRSYRGIPRLYRVAGLLAWVTPLWMVQLAKLIMPHVRRLFGIVNKEQVRFFVDMLHDAHPRFIRWSIRAILTWPGVELPAGLPVMHVHAAQDRIVPLRLAGPVTDVIHGAGHVVNLTHAQEVNAIIDRWLAGQGGGAAPGGAASAHAGGAQRPAPGDHRSCQETA